MLQEAVLGGLEASIGLRAGIRGPQDQQAVVKTLNTASAFAFQGVLPTVMWKTLRERQVMEIQRMLGETGELSSCLARPLKCRGPRRIPYTPRGCVLLPATA